MKRLLRTLIAGVIGLGLCGATLADDKGSKEDAVALTNAALAHVEKVGNEKAFQDFMDDKATWIKKDLYVFVTGHDGVSRSNGGNPKLVGKSLINLKDSNGKEFVKELVSTSKTKGEGWVDYEWANPTTKKIEGKSSYVRRLPKYDGLIGVGIYR